jgi:hypothetical protein
MRWITFSLQNKTEYQNRSDIDYLLNLGIVLNRAISSGWVLGGKDKLLSLAPNP